MNTDKIFSARNDCRTAYRISGDTVRYKELLAEAFRYADLLSRQGASPVIIYGRKSRDVLISVLACLISHRTYIPVDIFTSAERIKKITEISGAGLMIAAEETDHTECLKLSELENFSEDNVKSDTSNEIACMMFTPDLNAEPRYVTVTRSNLDMSVQWMNSLHPLSTYENINVLNTSSYSFDLSIPDFYYSMCGHHTLVALDKREADSYGYILRQIQENNIGLAVMTPSFMKLCLQDPDFNELNFHSIECVYFCGGVPEKEMIGKLFVRFPQLYIISAYIPAETALAAAASRITADMINDSDEYLPSGDTENSLCDIFIDDGYVHLREKAGYEGYISDRCTGYYCEDGISCCRTGDRGYIKDGILYLTYTSERKVNNREAI